MKFEEFDKEQHDVDLVSELLYNSEEYVIDKITEGSINHRIYFVDSLEKGDWDDHLKIITEEGKIIGCVSFYEHKMPAVYWNDLWEFNFLDMLNILLMSRFEEGELYIGNIAIIDEYQGKGYGTRILDAIVGYAGVSGFNRIVLDVNQQNLPARNFYKRFGFNMVGERILNIPDLCVCYKHLEFSL